MEQDNGKVAETGTSAMRCSATIGKLATALAKAQGKIIAAKRDSENPYFKSSYADLESVWNACRVQLEANQLAVIQALENNGDSATIVVITTLAHSSGEWVQSSLRLKPTKTDPQGIGSAITYGRRYALAAIVGVVPEGDDDDGAAGAGKESPAQTASRAKAAAAVQAQAPAPEGKPGTIGENAAATTCSFGKNAGRAWASMNTKQLEWYRDHFAEQLKNAPDSQFVSEWIVAHGAIKALLAKAAEAVPAGPATGEGGVEYQD